MKNKKTNESRSISGSFTLICLGSLVPLILTAILGPKSGLESLIIIVPLMASVGIHIILGPIALFLSRRDSNPFLVVFVWLYFSIFASISLGYWALVSDVPRDARSYWRDLVYPENAELSKLIRDQGTSVKQTRDAVQAGADVDHITPDMRTPLMEAVLYNRPEVVKVLLESGADPNQSGANGDTPLYMAAVSLQQKTLKILLDGGAAPSFDSGKESPLCRILRTVAIPKLPPLKVQIIKMLVDAGADGAGICSHNSDRSTYQVAIGYGMRSVVSLLVNAGHQIPNDPLHDDYGKALRESVSGDQAEWFQLLLKAGISPDAQYQSRGTAMEVAIGKRKLEYVQSLLSAGADPGLRAYVFQITRLSDDRTDLLKTLLAAGAAVDDVVVGKDGGALFQSAKRSRIEQVRLLIQAGANLDAPNKHGISMLISLQRRPLSDQKRQIIMTMLDAGANPRVNDSQERTALMISVQRGDVKLAEAFFQAGAQINARDSKGRTAAHLAAELYDSSAIISWLAKAGADFTLLNQEGLSPLCVAINKRRKNAIKAMSAIGSFSTECG